MAALRIFCLYSVETVQVQMHCCMIETDMSCWSAAVWKKLELNRSSNFEMNRRNTVLLIGFNKTGLTSSCKLNRTVGMFRSDALDCCFAR